MSEMNLKLKFFSTTFFLILAVSVNSQETPGLTFGGQYNDAGYTICNTGDKGYLLAGGTRTGTESSSDIYIVRLNKNNQVLWEKVYGDTFFDVARSVVRVHDGFVLTGDKWMDENERLDVCQMKIDNTGSLLWECHFGTSARENGFKVKLCHDGGFLIMGYSRGFSLWGAGDLFFIKTDEGGNELWQKNYGASHDDYGMDMIECEDGSIVITGTKSGFYNDVQDNYRVHDADIFMIKTDENGNELWQKTLGGTGHDFGCSITGANDGFFILGSTQSFGNGSFDMFLIKTDRDGNEEWHKTFGGDDYEYGVSIVKNNEGDLYLFGTTKSFGQLGSADYYLVKTDTQGNELWNLTIGGDSTDIGNSIIAGEDNGCMVIGQSKSFGNGKFDVLIVKVSKDGLIEDLASSTGNLPDSNFMIYPNPVSVSGRINFKSDVQRPELIMELFTVQGQSVKSYTLRQPDYNYSVETLPAGTYVYRIHSPDSSEILFSGKLIVR